MQSDYISIQQFKRYCKRITRDNALCLQLSTATGLRVSDCLALLTDRLAQKMQVTEAKTGKTKNITIPIALLNELKAIAGKKYVFEGRLNSNKHRTRQAVWKNLKAVSRLARNNVTPHTARKIFAVKAMHDTKSLEIVQQLLNHDNINTTLKYALSDILRQYRT